MKKIVSVGLLVIFSVLLVSCASSTAAEIEINEDKVPSIYSVIGEKKIVGTSSEIKNKVRSTTLTYKAGSISEKDIHKYIDYLQEEEFIHTLDSKQTSDGTLVQLGKDSVTTSDIVLVDLIYPTMDSESVKIMYRSGPGTLKMK